MQSYRLLVQLSFVISFRLHIFYGMYVIIWFMEAGYLYFLLLSIVSISLLWLWLSVLSDIVYRFFCCCCGYPIYIYGDSNGNVCWWSMNICLCLFMFTFIYCDMIIYVWDALITQQLLHAYGSHFQKLIHRF